MFVIYFFTMDPSIVKFFDGCYRDTLMSIAKHYETGEALPEEIFLKLLAARTFRAGSQSLRQVWATSWFFLCCILFVTLHFKVLIYIYIQIIANMVSLSEF